MAQIRIYADTSKGCIFFDGSNVEPKFLGTVVASVHPVESDRIVIARTDKTERDGVTLRKLFRRLHKRRVLSQDGVKLIDSIADGGLGYTTAEVVDYINAEANKTGTTEQQVLFPKLDILDFVLDETNTSILMSNGDHYGVNAIRAIEGDDGLCKIIPANADTPILYSINFDCATVNGTAANSLTNCVNQLNALFTVSALGGLAAAPSYTLTGGEQGTWQTAEVIDPVGDGIYAYGDTNSAYHGPRLWTTETIDEPGEYWTFEVANTVDGGGPLFGFGLYSVTNGDLAEIEDSTLSNSGHHGYWYSSWLYNYSGYTAPWTTYGSNSGTSYGPGWSFGATGDQFRYSDAHRAFRANGTALIKVGITESGHVGVWYYDVEDSDYSGSYGARTNDWILMAKSSAPLPEGQYGLLVKMANDSARMMTQPTRYAVDPVAPTLYYRYIESPDGVFHYPLFSSIEEANHADTLAGGIGEHHSHVYADDPSNTTWYMPNTGQTMHGSTPPVDTSEITYTEIVTEADSLHTPSAFAGALQVTEGDSINYQTQPQDTAYTTLITGLPVGLAGTSDGRIVGTAPMVMADSQISVTVSRTNSFGTSVGTLTLTINNSAALSNLPGFTVLNGNTESPNKILRSDDAVVEYGTPLQQGQEMTWLHSDFTSIGILNASGEAVKATANDLFADASAWEVKWAAWSNSINASNYLAFGFDDNSHQVTGDNGGITWKMAYSSADGKIRVYRNGALVLTSVSALTGDKTIVFGTIGNYSVDITLPLLTIADTAFTGTTPPVGFVDPILSGVMDDPTTLGGDANNASVAQLTDGLPVGKRMIVTKAFIEANMLPLLDDSFDKNYVGVPKTTANWGSVDLHSDFDAVFRLEWQAGNQTKISQTVGDSADANHVTTNSATSSHYAFAIEWDGADLTIVADANESKLSSEPSVADGGSFDRAYTYAGYSDRTGTLPVVFATKTGGKMGLSTSGINVIDLPAASNDVLVSEVAENDARFDVGNGPVTADNITLNAGTTYRFMLNNASVESGDTLTFEKLDGTAYTTGVTTVGSHGDYLYFVQFAVPGDVPPIRPVWNGNDQAALVISGSTYEEPVTGVSKSGPTANFTQNLLRSGYANYGWLTVDEPLGAGERILLSTAFLADLADALPDNSSAYIGVKTASWDNDVALDTYYPNIVVVRADEDDIRITVTGSAYFYTSVAGITSSGIGAFLEITGSGNNVRGAFGTEDITAVAYGDWTGDKSQTGDQGYGVTTAEVAMMVFMLSGNTEGFDITDVDYTALSEVSVPAPAETLTTNWTKAIDFSGSSQRLQQVTNNSFYSPIQMANKSTTTSVANTGETSLDGDSRPWATAIVFSSDNNYSNQHIWNQGEGSGTSDDNIYLRVASNRQLYFGWGRSGALNECYLGTLANGAGNWYGIYIAHNGTRLSSSNATAANLADCFDIYGVNLTTGVVGSQMSTSGNWGTNGGRMDRGIGGALTVGGRGSNRSFHGKVASMVVTTLKRGVPMPDATQISMMIRDPEEWMQTYRVGNTFRQATGPSNSAFYLNSTMATTGVGMWLMGDGTSDAYAKIRNQSYAADQNSTPLNMISMASNDIVTVNIPGLS